MRSHRSALGIALLATCIALVAAGRIRLGTDLADLLPIGKPSSDDYRLFMQRAGGVADAYVLLSAEKHEDAKSAALHVDLLAAVDRLEELLRERPEVAAVRAGPTEEDQRFFEESVLPRSIWLVGDTKEVSWIDRVSARLEPAAIRSRVQQLAAWAKTPVGTFDLEIAKLDPFGFNQLTEIPAGRDSDLGIPFDPLAGMFATDRAALLIVTPSRGEIDPEGGRQLEAALSTSFERVRAELGAPLVMRALGGPLYAAHDERLVRRDLERMITGSSIAIVICLTFAFSSFSAPLAAFVPVLVGLIWAAGLIGALRPELSAISVGFAAVLVGLGIDYGIHLGVRCRQERVAGESPILAVAAAWRHTRKGILTSGGTTAAGFAVLAFSSLQPIRDLALVVGLGIACIMAAVVAVGGAILVLPFSAGSTSQGWWWRMMGSAVGAASRIGECYPRTVISMGVLMTVLAVSAVGNISINPDFASLRPSDAPIVEAEELLVSEFGLGLDTATIIVHAETAAELFTRAEAVAEEVRTRLGADSGGLVSNPLSYLGSPVVTMDRVRASDKLEIGRAIKDFELEARAAGLDPRGFRIGIEALHSVAEGEAQAWPPVDDWPEWLSRSIDVSSKPLWAAIAVRLPEQRWGHGPPADLVEALHAIDNDVIVASIAAVGNELRQVAQTDIGRLGVIAFAVVIAAVLLSFGGDLRPAILSLTPVVVGTLWTVGLWSACGWALDLPAVAVLPILLGIGIDDGLHVVHATEQTTESGLGGAVRGTGRALVLTTVTTMLAFSSLLWSHIPGLRSAGLLIAVGVVACLLVTLILLPALGTLLVRDR